jgi:hypothetical protein
MVAASREDEYSFMAKNSEIGKISNWAVNFDMVDWSRRR